MSSTMNCFCKFITMENFFCINRNWLAPNQLKQKIGNYISILTPIVLACALIFDIIVVTDLSLRAFQFVLLLELLDLAIIARLSRKSFEAIAKLDAKCGINDEYLKEVVRRVAVATRVCIFSVILDVIGLYLLDVRVAVIIVLVVLFSTHDAELAFFTLLVDCMNLRLFTLEEQSPNNGSKIYRHVLVVTSYINEEFTPKIILMLGITIFTTVVYSIIIFLADPTMMWKISVYLFWREMKSLYSVWNACAAAAKSDAICRRLVFRLATRLALDESLSKNSKLYKTVRRWYTAVLSCRPCYISGSLLTIGLSVPLLVIDISFNYMIIIVQVIDYKEEGLKNGLLLFYGKTSGSILIKFGVDIDRDLRKDIRCFITENIVCNGISIMV